MKIIKKLKDLPGKAIEYKKKPVVIKAKQLDVEIEIETREGKLKGYPRDFVIEGIEGEIYPCDEKIFYKTYMPVYVNPDNKETQRKFGIYAITD